MNESNEKAEAIVVLGCRVHASGSPSYALARRTRRAVLLYDKGVAPLVVFTGGQGDFGGTEASTAARYAKDLGLQEEVILLEEKSTSTEENAAELAQIRGFEKIILVTDAYHSFRARRVFLKHFNEVRVQTVPTPFPVVLKSASREILAIAFYWVNGKI